MRNPPTPTVLRCPCFFAGRCLVTYLLGNFVDFTKVGLLLGFNFDAAIQGCSLPAHFVHFVLSSSVWKRHGRRILLPVCRHFRKVCRDGFGCGRGRLLHQGMVLFFFSSSLEAAIGFAASVVGSLGPPRVYAYASFRTRRAFVTLRSEDFVNGLLRRQRWRGCHFFGAYLGDIDWTPHLVGRAVHAVTRTETGQWQGRETITNAIRMSP